MNGEPSRAVDRRGDVSHRARARRYLRPACSIPTTSPAFPTCIRTTTSTRRPAAFRGGSRRTVSGVFGAHVVAFDPGNGDQVANFTLTRDGQFSIAGLAARPSRHPCRTARRRRHRQFLRFVGAGRPDVSAPSSSIVWSWCRAAATAASSKSPSPRDIAERLAMTPQHLVSGLSRTVRLQPDHRDRPRGADGACVRVRATVHRASDRDRRRSALADRRALRGRECQRDGLWRRHTQRVQELHHIRPGRRAPEAKILVRLTSSLDAEGSIAFGRSHLTTTHHAGSGSRGRDGLRAGHRLSARRPACRRTLPGGDEAAPRRLRPRASGTCDNFTTGRRSSRAGRTGTSAAGCGIR